MIIYNVTTHINNAVAADWLTWMKESHIPEVMKTNCFTEYKIVRLLETDESEGLTYAIQYYAAFKSDYNRYIELYATALRAQTITKWGNSFIAFRSLMEVVD